MVTTRASREKSKKEAQDALTKISPFALNDKRGWNDLPLELRRMIYERVDDRRILHFRTEKDAYESTEIGNGSLWLASPARQPVLLGLCPNSRQYVLDRYVSFGPPYPDFKFDPEKDVFKLTHGGMRGLGVPRLPLLSAADRGLIKNILILYTDANSGYSVRNCPGNYIAFWVSSCSNISTIYVTNHSNDYVDEVMEPRRRVKDLERVRDPWDVVRDYFDTTFGVVLKDVLVLDLFDAGLG